MAPGKRSAFDTAGGGSPNATPPHAAERGGRLAKLAPSADGGASVELPAPALELPASAPGAAAAMALPPAAFCRLGAVLSSAAAFCFLGGLAAPGAAGRLCSTGHSLTISRRKSKSGSASTASLLRAWQGGARPREHRSQLALSVLGLCWRSASERTCARLAGCCSPGAMQRRRPSRSARLRRAPSISLCTQPATRLSSRVGVAGRAGKAEAHIRAEALQRRSCRRPRRPASSS